MIYNIVLFNCYYILNGASCSITTNDFKRNQMLTTKTSNCCVAHRDIDTAFRHTILNADTECSF